jgi:hypothetical protein
MQLEGEHGPEIVWLNRGDHVSPAATLKVRPCGNDVILAALIQDAYRTGQIRLPGARGDDDGSAGVPAVV